MLQQCCDYCGKVVAWDADTDTVSVYMRAICGKSCMCGDCVGERVALLEAYGRESEDLFAFIYRGLKEAFQDIFKYFSREKIAQEASCE